MKRQIEVQGARNVWTSWGRAPREWRDTEKAPDICTGGFSSFQLLLCRVRLNAKKETTTEKKNLKTKTIKYIGEKNKRKSLLPWDSSFCRRTQKALTIKGKNGHMDWTS